MAKKDWTYILEEMLYNETYKSTYGIQFNLPNNTVMVCHGNISYLREKMADIVQAFNDGMLNNYCHDNYFFSYATANRNKKLRTAKVFGEDRYFIIANFEPIIVEEPILIVEC